jgi:CBS domain-containing protein
MKNTSITTIMTRQLQYITPHDEIIEAKKLMNEYKIHHLPVLLNDKLVGIISSNDIAQIEYLCDFIGSKLDESTIFKSLSIHEVMTKDVVSLNSDAKIADAILMFSNVSFHSLPIIEDGQLIGIVTAKDVFRYLSLK